MVINRGGDVALVKAVSTREGRMAAYDALPARMRKLLQEAPYNISVTNLAALSRSDAVIRATMTRVARESARATYGKNYPVDLIKI